MAAGYTLHGAELNEGPEVFKPVFMPRHEPTELPGPGKTAFDLPTVFVSTDHPPIDVT